MTEEAMNEIISIIKDEIQLFDQDDVRAECDEETARKIAAKTREIALEKADSDEIKDIIDEQADRAHMHGCDYYADPIAYNLSQEIINDAYIEAIQR